MRSEDSGRAGITNETGFWQEEAAMFVAIVMGLSGAGKTLALHMLED